MDRAAFDAACTASLQHRWRLAVSALLPPALRARLDAEDVVQDVLHRAWLATGELEDHSPRGFERWVDRILERRVLDLIRHHGRQRRDAGREQPVLTDPSWRPPDDPGEGPGPAAARREQRARIVAVLDGLEPAYRRVIVLRVLQGYSTREVAQIVDKSPENVAVTLHRALVRLREALAREGIESTLFRPLR